MSGEGGPRGPNVVRALVYSIQTGVHLRWTYVRQHIFYNSKRTFQWYLKGLPSVFGRIRAKTEFETRNVILNALYTKYVRHIMFMLDGSF